MLHEKIENRKDQSRLLQITYSKVCKAQLNENLRFSNKPRKLEHKQIYFHVSDKETEISSPLQSQSYCNNLFRKPEFSFTLKGCKQELISAFSSRKDAQSPVFSSPANKRLCLNFKREPSKFFDNETVKNNFETLESNRNKLNNDYISLIICCRDLNKNKDIESFIGRKTINEINTFYNSSLGIDKLSPIFDLKDEKYQTQGRVGDSSYNSKQTASAISYRECSDDSSSSVSVNDNQEDFIFLESKF